MISLINLNSLLENYYFYKIFLQKHDRLRKRFLLVETARNYDGHGEVRKRFF